MSVSVRGHPTTDPFCLGDRGNEERLAGGQREKARSNETADDTAINLHFNVGTAVSLGFSNTEAMGHGLPSQHLHHGP